MKHLSLLFCGLAFPALALAQSYYSSSSPGTTDPTFSRVTVEKTMLKADGIDNTLVTVTVKDTNLVVLQGSTLSSSRRCRPHSHRRRHD